MSSDALPDPDIEWCYDAIQGVSRTFALTVDTLEEPMSSHICVGYLLCRVADTIEDASRIPPKRQAHLLRSYEAAIAPTTDYSILQFRETVADWVPPEGERTDDWEVVAQVPRIWATFDNQPGSIQKAIISPVREMVGGMAMFVDRHADTDGLRISDRPELEQYSYYVAGTVGKLITNLLTRKGLPQDRVQTLYDTAVDFGLLLQLVNISKDVYDDYREENNVYLPAEWLENVGVGQDAILKPSNRDSAAHVVERTTTHAATFLDEAQTFLEAMPLTHGNTIAAWTVPYLLSVATIRELKSRPKDALTESGVKVSRKEVLAVLDTAKDVSRDSVAALRDTISQRPYHQQVNY